MPNAYGQTTYVLIWNNWYFQRLLAHNLANHQYFLMIQVYSFSTIALCNLCLFQLNISLILWPKNQKKCTKLRYFKTVFWDNHFYVLATIYSYSFYFAVYNYILQLSHIKSYKFIYLITRVEITSWQPGFIITDRSINVLIEHGIQDWFYWQINVFLIGAC